MTTTKIYASLNDLTKQPCNAYHNLPKDQELDVIAEIIRVRGRLILDDLTWVIANCPKLQTTEILDTFIAQKPEAHEIRTLITVCAFAQSDKMLDAYLNTNPTKQEIRFGVIILNELLIGYSENVTGLGEGGEFNHKSLIE